MSFDCVLLNRVVNLLNQKILYTRINKIYQISPSDFVFVLFSKNIKTNLIISTNNNGSYFSLIDKVDKDKFPKDHFVNSLFYHLVNGTIINIEQINNDRIVKFTVKKIDEIGFEKTSYLFAELTGKVTNLILTKDDENIIDCLHKTGISSYRTIANGAKYRIPFYNNENSILSENLDTNLNISNLSGLSLNLAKEIKNRINNNVSLDNIISELKTSTKLYIYKNDYHLIELKHLEPLLSKEDIFEGLNNYYKNRPVETKSNDYKELLKIINRELKHNLSKVEKLNEELKNAENSDTFLENGDLIFTYCHNLDVKQSLISINKDDKNIEIPLDEKITVKENALKFYKKYQKLRNSKKIINEQIQITKEKIEYFENLKFQIESSDFNSLSQIKDELIELKILKDNRQKQTKKKQEIKLEEHFIDNVKISVGKNNIQNEFLTFKLAKYNEYFFHVKDYSGSHVVVHADTLNEKLIRYAANLAAINSKAKDSSSVPVNYTQIRNIKKIPGNVPGKVFLKEYKTIYIDPKAS